jgi:hypothetical protein
LIEERLIKLRMAQAARWYRTDRKVTVEKGS